MSSQRQLLTSILAGIVLIGILFALYIGVKGGKLLSKAEGDDPLDTKVPVQISAYEGNKLYDVNIGYKTEGIPCPKNWGRVNDIHNSTYGGLSPGKLIGQYDTVEKERDEERNRETEVGEDRKVTPVFRKFRILNFDRIRGRRERIEEYLIVQEITDTPVLIHRPPALYRGSNNNPSGGEEGGFSGLGFDIDTYTFEAPLLGELTVVRGKPKILKFPTSSDDRQKWYVVCKK